MGMNKHYQSGLFPPESQLNIYQHITVKYPTEPHNGLGIRYLVHLRIRVWVGFKTGNRVPLRHLPLHNQVIPILPHQNKPGISLRRSYFKGLCTWGLKHWRWLGYLAENRRMRWKICFPQSIPRTLAARTLLAGKMAQKKDLKRMKVRYLPTQWPDTGLFMLSEATVHSFIHSRDMHWIHASVPALLQVQQTN